MAYTTGHFGASTIGALLGLIATRCATSFVFMVVVLGGVLLLVGLRPLRTFRYFRAEILLALGASSSEGALPGIVRKPENVDALNCLGFLAAPISVTAPVVESTGERSTPPRIHPAGRIRDGCAGDCD